MHTYILQRYGRNKFLVKEGWNIKSYGNIFYDNDEIVGELAPDDDYYFDGCWVYWNKKFKRFCHLNYDKLNELSKKRFKAINLGTTEQVEDAYTAYYEYLANPEFLTGENEMRYILLHKYPIDFMDLSHGKENAEEQALLEERLVEWKKREGIK